VFPAVAQGLLAVDLKQTTKTSALGNVAAILQTRTAMMSDFSLTSRAQIAANVDGLATSPQASSGATLAPCDVGILPAVPAGRGVGAGAGLAGAGERWHVRICDDARPDLRGSPNPGTDGELLAGRGVDAAYGWGQMSRIQAGRLAANAAVGRPARPACRSGCGPGSDPATKAVNHRKRKPRRRLLVASVSARLAAGPHPAGLVGTGDWEVRGVRAVTVGGGVAAPHLRRLA